MKKTRQSNDDKQLRNKTGVLVLTDRIMAACQKNQVPVTENKVQDMIILHMDLFQNCVTEEQFASAVQKYLN